MKKSAIILALGFCVIYRANEKPGTMDNLGEVFCGLKYIFIFEMCEKYKHSRLTYTDVRIVHTELYRSIFQVQI